MKYSQKSKYPQLKSPGCLRLQRYILESDYGISTNVGMAFLCKLKVKQYVYKDVQKDALQVMKTEENTWCTSVATALSAADLREAPTRACSLAEQVSMTLFLAALTSALFLHSLLECKEEKQGPETVQSKIKKKSTC